MATEESSLVRYDPFAAMDRLDDEAILAELEGRVMKALVYSFNQGGQTVTGLSKAGVDATVREMAKQHEVIRELDCTFQDFGNDALFTAKAGRYAVKFDSEQGKAVEVLLDTRIGTKRQSKKMPNGRDNPFWFEQGSMKALRNANMRLLREDLKQAIIARAMAEGGVREVRPEEAAIPETPRQQATGSRKPSDAQIRRLRAIQKAHQVSDEALHAYLQEIHKLASVNDITLKQYETVCNWLEGKIT